MSSPRDEREPQSAPSDVDKALAELRKKLGQVETSRARFAARTEKLQAELNAARAQVAWFHRQLFGQKAERISPAEIEAEFRQYLAEQELQANNEETRPAPVIEDELTSVQLLMDLGVPGPETPQARRGADETAKRHTITPSRDADDAPKPPPEKKKRKGHGRKKVPPTLREETVVIEPEVIPEGARQVGAEVSYRVGMRRPELVRFAIVRPKYAVDDDETATSKIVVAEPPHEMIPRGLFAPSGLAHIIANRHDRSVPFNRMKRFFADSGYEIPVSTLSGVAMRAVPLVKDLLQAMKAYAQDVAPYLAIDATGVLLQQPERCLRGHVWLRYIENVCVLVSFTERHDSQSASEQLDGWRCPTLADGAQVFDAKHRETDNPRAGCWSHGRRKLVYAAPTDGRALVGVRWINELFAIEREILDASPEQRLAVRAERSAPVIDQLFAWRDDLLAHGNLGRSMLAGALRYMRNQQHRLRYFLEDGQVPIHNNLAELQARHLAVGRKNWLFFGSQDAADAGCVWLSLVLSARMHNLDVERYLRDLFRVLPLWPAHRILELAPHQWKTTRPRLDTLEMSRELGRITIPPATD